MQDWSQGDDEYEEDVQNDHDDDHNDHDDNDDPDDHDGLNDEHEDEDWQPKVEKLDLQRTEYALFPSLIHQVATVNIVSTNIQPIFTNIQQFQHGTRWQKSSLIIIALSTTRWSLSSLPQPSTILFF